MEPDYPKRNNIRLKDYDYAGNGAYFVTVCTYERRNILWTVASYIKSSPKIGVKGDLVAKDSEDRISHLAGHSPDRSHMVFPFAALTLVEFNENRIHSGSNLGSIPKGSAQIW